MSPAWNPAVVSAYDVSMVTPDIICIEVRDQQITKGSIASYGVSKGTYDQQLHITNPATGLTEYGNVCGDNTYVRFTDKAPTLFLNRATADLAANYSGSSLGGRTVTNVYRVTKPLDSYQDWSGAAHNDGVTMRHWIYLKLSGSLSAGSCTIVNSAFPTVSFTYNDKTTRACSIHATQIGHRAADGQKLATLSHWIPGFGTEGRIDIPTAYSITSFSIINSSGTAVYTGTTGGGQITLNINPTTAETLAGAIRMPSTTTAPKTITGMTNANPCVVTINGHGYANGDIKMLRGLLVNGVGGMGPLECQFVKVANATANTFSLQDINGVAIDSTGYNAFLTGTIASGFQNLCYDTFLTNRAGTYVYQLDYSAWTSGTAGTYYVYVPGIGVSYPFQIGENVHYLLAKTSVKGYYNQLWGVALDSSIGGVTRPINYKDGVNGVVIYRSKLPAAFGSETFALSNIYQVDSGTGGPGSTWDTGTRMTGWGGGWSDAGDWDQQLINHCGALFSLLEWGYMRLPSGARGYNMNFPRMTTLLDPTTYAGTNSMGDAVHMAMAYLDVYRRFQDATGWVVGGFAYDGAGGGGGGAYGKDPSYISPIKGYCLGPDHASNYCYAAVAAKAALAFNLAGFTTLGTLWQNSAELAWDWAEALFQDYKTNGVAGTTITNFYGSGGINIATKAYSGNTTTYAAAMAELQNVCSSNTSDGKLRYWACGTLYRLTNNYTKYGSIMYAQECSASGTCGLGVAEFIKATDLSSRSTTPWGQTGTQQAAYYPTQFINSTDNQFEPATPRVSPYKFSEQTTFFSTTEPSMLLEAFNNSTQSQSNKYLKRLHAGGDFFTGGNQENLCLTAGIGSHFTINPLIRDREFMGLSGGNAWPGVTLFTWFPTGVGTAPFNFADGAATTNFTVDRPLVATDPRVIEPFYQAIPYMQRHVATTYNVSCTEFTTETDIVPTFLTALWRWAWDGNTSTTP